MHASTYDPENTNDPTPEQIAQMCQAIRDTWRRGRFPREEQLGVMEIDQSELNAAVEFNLNF